MKAKVKTQVLVVWLSLKLSGKGDLQSCKWHVLRSCVIICVFLFLCVEENTWKKREVVHLQILHLTVHSYVIVMFY